MGGTTSITFEKQANLHCYESTFGADYETLQYAMNSCISNPTCGAVYEQACEDLTFTVRLRDGDDEALLAAIVKKVTLPPPVGGNSQNSAFTTATEVYEVQHTGVVNSITIMPGSMVSNEADYLKIRSSSIHYPLDVHFSIKPSNGAIRTCVKSFVTGASSEGSCVHVKRGALLAFQAYSNFRTEQKYELTGGSKWASEAAGCADFCLSRTDCTAFLHVIKTEGSAPTSDSCLLLGMPPDFTYPDDLIPVDGMLQVSDFYVRDIALNNNRTGNQDVESGGGESGAQGSFSMLPGGLVTFLLAIGVWAALI